MKFGPSSDVWDLALFASLVESVIPEIEKTDDVVELLKDKLSEWSDILQSLSVQKDNRMQIVGLWGEVAHLQHYLNIFGNDALDCWRGPDSNSHDFEFLTESVEIKTTASPSAYVAKINGIAQLDNFEGKPLKLRFARVGWSLEGRTLPEMIQAVLVNLPEEKKSIFEAKLVQVGYHQWSKQQLDAHRLVLSESCEFDVIDDFPRIVVGSLAETVDVSRLRRVEYEITLPAQLGAPYPLQLGPID
jgi:hypothetical protein